MRVAYYASLREVTGRSEEDIRLPDASTVEALLGVVGGIHEPLRGVGRILVAVNGEFADPDTRLREGDVVALFPPVSGG